jgi:hypothetical protein
VTTAALAAVATCTLVFLVEHPLFAVPATVALLASLVLFPVGGIWWVLSAIGWSRRPAASERELDGRLTRALTVAWVSLAVLLPATYAWIWLGRVEWLVF